MVERFAALFGGIDEDLERLFDALLADILRQPSADGGFARPARLQRAGVALPRDPVERTKFGATANGGICLWDHALSIAEQVELLF